MANKMEFRTVVYRNGYPVMKVEFATQEQSEKFRDDMIARRQDERAKGLWKGVSWHYISEYNH